MKTTEREWIIRASTPDATEDDIVSDGLLPPIGSPFEGRWALLSYSFSRVGRFTFRVVGRYSIDP